jgi:hypothetical protein
MRDDRVAKRGNVMATSAQFLGKHQQRVKVPTAAAAAHNQDASPASRTCRYMIHGRVLSSIAPGRSGWSDIRRPMIRPLPEDQRNAVRGV